jgi:hypothetical protein
MTKFITLLIGLSLSFAAAAQAKRAEQENPKNKKSQPVQKQQVAPKQQQVAPRQQQKAPNPQMQAKPKQQQSFYPLSKPVRRHDTKPPKNDPGSQRYIDVPPTVQPKAPKLRDNARVRQTEGTQQNLTTLPPKKDGSLADGRYRLTAPAVQSNKLNKTVKTFKPRHQNFQARVNPAVASVRFNQNFRIRNAENWKGHHYNAFRTYRPQWHDRGWWRSNHSHIVLIGGGWYYWNSGYWYPAWGYDDSAAYYPYDGPIYVGSSPRPFDQVVADVQSSLQEQGYYRGEVDGLVGPLTQEALAGYQSAQGLEPTAAIDQPTLESLGIS